MSAPSSDSPKQGMNVYTVMLIVATVNIIIAAFLLWSELSGYGEFPYYKTSAAEFASLTAWV